MTLDPMYDITIIILIKRGWNAEISKPVMTTLTVQNYTKHIWFYFIPTDGMHWKKRPGKVSPPGDQNNNKGTPKHGLSEVD